MTLKVNSMYKIADGYLIPVSHFKKYDTKEKGVEYAVFRRLVIENGGHYIARHYTMTKAEIKKALGLAKNERVEIV